MCFVLCNPGTGVHLAVLEVNPLFIIRVACAFFGEDPCFRLNDQDVFKVVGRYQRGPESSNAGIMSQIVAALRGPLPMDIPSTTDYCCSFDSFLVRSGMRRAKMIDIVENSKLASAEFVEKRSKQTP